jgi:hypothetical protein
MASFWRENQLVLTQKKSLKKSSWFGEPTVSQGSRLFISLFSTFFIVYFYLCCSNSLRMGNMLQIENIVESAPTFPFLTNF